MVKNSKNTPTLNPKALAKKPTPPVAPVKPAVPVASVKVTVAPAKNPLLQTSAPTARTPLVNQKASDAAALKAQIAVKKAEAEKAAAEAASGTTKFEKTVDGRKIIGEVMAGGQVAIASQPFDHGNPTGAYASISAAARAVQEARSGKKSYPIDGYKFFNVESNNKGTGTSRGGSNKNHREQFASALGYSIGVIGNHMNRIKGLWGEQSEPVAAATQNLIDSIKGLLEYVNTLPAEFQPRKSGDLAVGATVVLTAAGKKMWGMIFGDGDDVLLKVTGFAEDKRPMIELPNGTASIPVGKGDVALHTAAPATEEPAVEEGPAEETQAEEVEEPAA